MFRSPSTSKLPCVSVSVAGGASVTALRVGAVSSAASFDSSHFTGDVDGEVDGDAAVVCMWSPGADAEWAGIVQAIGDKGGAGGIMTCSSFGFESPSATTAASVSSDAMSAAAK